MVANEAIGGGQGAAGLTDDEEHGDRVELAAADDSGRRECRRVVDVLRLGPVGEDGVDVLEGQVR